MSKCILVLFLLMPVLANSQDLTLFDLITNEAENRVLTDPDIASPVQSNKQGFRVTASTGSKSVAINFAFRDLSLILEGPIGDTDLTQLITLQGLSNSVTVDVGFKSVLWSKTAEGKALREQTESFSAIYNELQNEETAQEAARILTKDPQREEKLEAVVAKMRSSCPQVFSDEGRLNKAVLKDRVECQQNLRVLVEEKAEELKQSFVVGARVKYGLEEFEFLIDSAETEKDTKSNWAPVIFGGFISNAKRFYIGVNYMYEISHRAGEEVTVCEPFNAIPNGSRCKNEPFGPPNEFKSHLSQAELRWYISDSFAVNPRVTYSSAEEATGFEFPLYFIKSEDNDDPSLTGGVSIGWRTDQDRPILSVFVGAIGLFDWLQ